MTIPAHWMNIATKIERFEVGDQLSVMVVGGCVGREMPCSGLLVTMRDGSTYIVPDDVPEPAHDDVEAAAASIVKAMGGFTEDGRRRIFELLEWSYCHRCGSELEMEPAVEDAEAPFPKPCPKIDCLGK
jgi:hypothetical protein